MYCAKQKYFFIIVFYLMLLDRGGFKGRSTYHLLLAGIVILSCAVWEKGFLVIENRLVLRGKALILLGGLLSSWVGIDRGERLFGLIRLVAVLVMSLAAGQLDEKDKKFFLRTIPIAGIVAVAGCFLHHFSFFRMWLSPTGRTSGPFGYANTMALFLILGIVISGHSEKKVRWFVQMLLLLGLFATGSRTGFVILCGYLIWNFVRYRGRNKFLLFTFLCVAGIIGAVSLIGGDLPAMGRFLKISINASTLQGRFLYWEDAVRMLLKRPAGLGYMGYFYFQQAQQTGLYSVRFVHNEWLQWILDYGIIAGIGLGVYIIHSKADKLPSMNKELLCIICLYSFFDFHLQFLTIVMIVLILLPSGERVWICDGGKKKRMGWKCGLLLSLALSAGMSAAAGIADCYAQEEEYTQAVKWNPLSSLYKQEYLLQSEDLSTANAYADKLLQDNRYLYAAYLIKSNAAAEDGKLDEFIINRRRALGLRKYNIEEYEEYFEILYSWYQRAREEKNMQETGICLSAMREIPQMLNRTKRNTSLRAYRIKEKPNLTLHPQYGRLLEKIEK